MNSSWSLRRRDTEATTAPNNGETESLLEQIHHQKLPHDPVLGKKTNKQT